MDSAPFDPDADLVRDVRSIAAELRKYDENLYRKPRWLVFNKIDMLAPEERDEVCSRILKGLRWRGKSFRISALTGEGCEHLSAQAMNFLERLSVRGERDEERETIRRQSR